MQLQVAEGNIIEHFWAARKMDHNTARDIICTVIQQAEKGRLLQSRSTPYIYRDAVIDKYHSYLICVSGFWLHGEIGAAGGSDLISLHTY